MVHETTAETICEGVIEITAETICEGVIHAIVVATWQQMYFSKQLFM